MKKIVAILLISLISINAKGKNLKEELTSLRKRISQLERAQQDQEFNYANTSSGWWNKTSIGGYGELHYKANEHDDNEVDFHRWVLFLTHQFNSTTRFITEFELEHAVAADGEDGEVELEQAYIEIDLSDSLKLKTGTFLVPIGILNETHEPNTFYGVERNRVENVIIPTTWWESGIALQKNWESGLQLDVAIHSGLSVPTTGKNAYRIRSGRGKASKQNADDLAYTARLKYQNGGLELGAGLNYQVDLTQDNTETVRGLLLNAYINYQTAGGFGLRALYASWDIDTPSGITNRNEAQNQDGFYIEPSYKWQLKRNSSIGLYARYSAVNAVKIQDNFTRWEIGVNYWPIDNVVFKADFAQETADATNVSNNSFNLGVGYQF